MPKGKEKIIKNTKTYTKVPNSIFTLKDLTIESKYIYLYLLFLPEDFNPSIKKIQEDTGMSKSTVYRARNALKKHGLLSWERRGNRSVLYHILTIDDN